MAGNVKNKIIILVSLLVCRNVDGQITSRPENKEVCKDTNVELKWVFEDASNFLTVTWDFIDSSSTTTIMQITIGDTTATVFQGFNVEYNGNGAITLIAVSSSNTGNYKIKVTYTSSTLPDDDTVTVTVIDCDARTTSESDVTVKIVVPCVIGGLFLIGICIGVFMFCVNKEWNVIYCSDNPPWPVWISCIIVVGFGILIVFGIRHCCNGKGTTSPQDDARQGVESSTDPENKQPQTKLMPLNESGDKHHIGGRPLPEIGKYN